MAYWQSARFKAMQDAWYAKLKASGFEDAEELIAGEMVLRHNAEYVFRDMGSTTARARASYFSYMSEMVHQTKFRNDVDCIILSLRAAGARMKAIREALLLMGFKKSRRTIRVIIRRYEMTWGMKDYLPGELNQYPKDEPSVPKTIRRPA